MYLGLPTPLAQQPSGKPGFCVNYRKINEDTVQDSSSPFSADDILHFLALIHLLSASLGAPDILLSLKNLKQKLPLFLLQRARVHSTLGPVRGPARAGAREKGQNGALWRQASQVFLVKAPLSHPLWCPLRRDRVGSGGTISQRGPGTPRSPCPARSAALCSPLRPALPSALLQHTAGAMQRLGTRFGCISGRSPSAPPAARQACACAPKEGT